MASGAAILEKVDPDNTLLTVEEHHKLLECKHGQAVAQLFKIELGNTINPNIQAAYDAFAQLEKLEIEIPRMLLMFRFYTISQQMLLIEDNRKLSRDKNLTASERLTALKIAQQSIQRLDWLVKCAQTLAKEYAESRKDDDKPAVRQVTAVAPSLD